LFRPSKASSARARTSSCRKSACIRVWVAAFAVHSKIERTQLLLKQIDKALLRFKAAR
jgi:hypothetical protein